MKSGDLRFQLRCAFEGLIHVIKTQSNVRIHVTILFLVILAGCYFKINLSQWVLVVVASFAVFITETINTAIETVVDLVTTDYHLLAKIAKDVAAAAVLLAAIQSVIIGIIVFMPHILELFR